MNQRMIKGLLTIGCVALAGMGYMTCRGQDNIKPKIELDKSEKITYTEGESYEKLLKGATAEDNEDGNLTDQVFVDKIVPISKKKAVVYYGVVDKANNVGTARREIAYHESDSDDITDDEMNIDAVEDKETIKKAKKTEKESQTIIDNQQDDELEQNSTMPVIKLAEETKTIVRGETFNPLGEVTDAVDDKDDRDTLFRGVHIDGDYDVNQVGTYTLKYYVRDSDGNVSEPITFTLTVQ